MIIDVIWVINIILKFITPYDSGVGPEDRFYEIALKYLFPGFLCDVASTLTLLTNYNYYWMYYLKFLRVIYFPRSITILHDQLIDPIVKRCNVSKQARSNVQSIFSQFIILVTIMHMIACAWIFVGEKEGWGSWLTNPGFASVYTAKQNGDYSTIYITSLYWVVTTLTTVGYGDYYGTTQEEYIFTMIVEFIGILVFSIIMSTVNNFL